MLNSTTDAGSGNIVSDEELYYAGVVLGLRTPARAYYARHPELQYRPPDPPVDPLNEIEQERILKTIVTDAEFRRALLVALRGQA